MPMLGDVLATARRSAQGVERWLLADHPALHARLDEVAMRDGMSVVSFARVAVADYERWADEEAWATVTSRMRNSDNPGAACLLAMLEWRLARLAPPGAPEGGPHDGR